MPRNFKIVSENHSFNKRFAVATLELSIKLGEDSLQEFNKNIDNQNLNPMRQGILGWYYNVYEELIDYLKSACNIQPRDSVGMKIQIPSIENVKPLGFHFREFQTYSSDIIVDQIGSVLQSNDSFSIASILEIVVTVARTESGGSAVPLLRCGNDFDKIIRHKKSVITSPYRKIGDDENKCLPEALIIGKKYADECNSLKKTKKYLAKFPNRLINDTYRLIHRSFGSIDAFNKNNNSGGIIADLYKYSKVLKDYQITVYDDKYQHNKIVFTTQKRSKKIFLYFFTHLKHFICITSAKSFFARQFQCEFCDRLLYTDRHKCKSMCSSCFTSPPHPAFKYSKNNTNLKCDICMRYFKNDDCFAKHFEKIIKVTDKDNKKQLISVCEAYYVCNKCFKLVQRKYAKKYHVCDEIVCQICRKYVKNDHTCFIQSYDKETPEKYILIWYDIETVLQEIPSNSADDAARKNIPRFSHVANLVCAQIACDLCESFLQNDYECEYCKKRSYSFEGRNCVRDFLEFCSIYRPNSKGRKVNTICIAHNAKSYDLNFIIREMFKKPNSKVEPIMTGLKILKVTYNNCVTFIDSFSFMQVALRKLPKMFGFDDVVVGKGIYPYYFNSFENYHYIGELPDKKYYGVHEYGNDEEIAKFDSWYNELKSINYTFDNRYELIKYCMNDVYLLRVACVKVAETIRKIVDIHPFLESFTLPQCVLLAFRKKFLIPNTVPIIPSNNYNSNVNQSKGCKKWLAYLNYFKKNENVKTTKKFIQNEVKLASGYFVDGYDFDGNVYEFYGCYYHGHPVCYDENYIQNQNRMKSKMSNYSKSIIVSRYHQTLAKEQRLRNLGYTVNSIWECEWNNFIKTNKELCLKIENHHTVKFGHLNPRDALRGGRVEPFYGYIKSEKNKKIRYIDVCSLYPFTMITTTYLKGPLLRLRYGKECDNISIDEINALNGLIYLTILPPQTLLVPFLGMKVNGKLFFVLCMKCAQLQNTNTCIHDETDRALTSVYTSCEIKVALKYGYKILKLHEIWEYEAIKYDSDSDTDGLFNKFQQHFLKIKIENSDYPSDIITDSYKKLYIENFAKLNGIILDESNIKLNKPMKQVGKNMANQLWGKLCMNTDRSQTVVLDEAYEFTDLLNNPNYKILDVYTPSDNHVWINFKNETACDRTRMLKNTSLLSGIFTTANARIIMYEYLNLIGNNKKKSPLIYTDTDSIIYLQDEKDENQFIAPTGNYLGDFTNELEQYKTEDSDEPFIDEFICIAPKVYAMLIKRNENDNDPIEIIKVKGHTLNSRTTKQINFKSLKSLFFYGQISDADEFINVKQRKIRVEKYFNVKTNDEMKKLQFSFDKRILLNDYSSVPWGYLHKK